MPVCRSVAGGGSPLAAGREPQGRGRDLAQVHALFEQRLHFDELRVEGLGGRLAHLLPQPLAAGPDHLHGRGRVATLELLLDVTLDRSDQTALRGQGQRDGHALAPGSAGAADAVHVGVRVVGRVEVDHVGDVVDVQPTSRYVGGDQDLGATLSEAPQHLLSGCLAQVAVQGAHGVPQAVEALGEVPAVGAGAQKDQRRADLLDLQQPVEHLHLVGLSQHDELLIHVGQREPTRLAADVHRLAGVGPGHVAGGRRHGGREHRRLVRPIAGQLAEDLLDVVDEAHLEHLVGFIEHHELHVVEAQQLPPQQVEHPPGGPDHDLRPLPQLADLKPHGLPAVDRHHPHLGAVAAELPEGRRHLQRQLPGRCQHERLHPIQ